MSYTHGIDRLDWLTIDRVAFESDTVAFRVGFDFTPFAGVEGGYDFQSRPAASAFTAPAPDWSTASRGQTLLLTHSQVICVHPK